MGGEAVKAAWRRLRRRVGSEVFPGIEVAYTRRICMQTDTHRKERVREAGREGEREGGKVGGKGGREGERE